MNNITDNSTSGLQDSHTLKSRQIGEISLLGRKIMTMVSKYELYLLRNSKKKD